MDSDDRPAWGFIWFLTGAALFAFVAYLGVWLHGTHCRDCLCGDCSANYFNNWNQTLVAALGAIAGFVRARRAPGGAFQGLGGVVTLLSSGLLLWAAGSVVWFYHASRFNNPIPYPSLADAGYLLQIPLWTIAIVAIFRQTDRNLLTEMGSPLAVMVPIAGGIVTAFVFAHGDGLKLSNDGDMIKFVFDIAFPLGGILNTTLLAALVCGTPAAGSAGFRRQMQHACYALFAGTLLLTAADFIFNFTTSVPAKSVLAYYNGNWVDFVYWLGLYFMAFGICLLPRHKGLLSEPVSTTESRAQPAPAEALARSLSE